MTNEELRGAILKITCDAQEAGQLPFQSGQYREPLAHVSEVPPTDVQIANAIGYLSDRGYVNAKGRPTLDGMYYMVTGLTSRGFDQVDGREHSSAITQNVQIIGTNYGQAVQHGTINVQTLAFPADVLREQLKNHPEVSAVDEIEEELRSSKPRISRIVGAIETLKALTDLPAVVRTVTTWVSKPEVQHFIASHLSR